MIKLTLICFVLLLFYNNYGQVNLQLDSLSKLYLKEFNLEESHSLANKIKSLNTDKDSTFINLIFDIKKGNTSLESKNLDEALYILTKSNININKLNPIDNFYKAQILQSLGEVYLYKGNPKNAHLYFDSTILVYKKNKDSLGIAKMLMNKASIFLHLQNEYDSTILYLNKTENYASKDTLIKIKILLKKGSVLHSKNIVDSSIYYLFEAYKLSNYKKDSTNIFISANYLSDIYYKNKDFKKSLEYGKTALTISEKLHNKRMELSALINYASPLQELKRPDESIKLLLKANKLANELNDIYSKAVINQNLGTIYQMNNEINIAKQYYLDAKYDFEKLNYYNGLANCYRNLGGVEHQLKNYETAKNYFIKSLNLAKELNQIDVQLECYESLYLTSKESKEYEKSLNYYEKFNLIKDSLNEIKYSESINKIEQEYKINEQKLELEKQKRITQLANEKASSDKKLFISLTIILLLVLGVLGYFLISLKRKGKQREKALKAISEKIKQKETESKHLIKQIEIISKEAKTKDEVIEHLKNKTTRQSNSTLLAELIQKGLNTEKGWSIFTTEFQLQYKSFYNNLNKSASKPLTKTDIRVCALIKLNLTSSEIAEILNITNSGIKKARQRVREKLSVPDTISLTDFIQNL